LRKTNDWSIKKTARVLIDLQINIFFLRKEDIFIGRAIRTRAVLFFYTIIKFCTLCFKSSASSSAEGWRLVMI